MSMLSGAAIVELERQQKVMSRVLVSYDYEKVFWRSVYGVGLVGLGWVSLELGNMIRSGQKLVEGIGFTEVPADPTSITIEQYNKLYPWVDPSGIRYNDLVPQGPVGMMYLKYRNEPAIWEAIKAEFIAAGEVAGPDENVPPGAPKPEPVDRALAACNWAFNKFGAIIPPALVGYNVATEAVRIRRLKGDLRK